MSWPSLKNLLEFLENSGPSEAVFSVDFLSRFLRSPSLPSFIFLVCLYVLRQFHSVTSELTTSCSLSFLSVAIICVY